MTTIQNKNLNSQRSETNVRLGQARRKADKGISDRLFDSETDLQNLLASVREKINLGQASSAKEEMLFVDRVIKSEWQNLRFAAESLIASERQVTDSALGSERAEADRISETTRLAQEESENSLEAINQFVAIVSHDLKNPLGAISMSAILIEQALEVGDLNANRLRRALDIIKKNSMGMDRMISDLLDVQRIKFGKLDLNRTPVGIFTLLTECHEMFGEIAAKKSISLQLSNEMDPAIIYDIDHDRILQALANLIGNALKFTQPGGAVSLSVVQTDADVRIHVKDSGPGISIGLMPHLFDRFSQGNRPHRTGLGLGLHISKAIVDAHGGKIEVNSEQGLGTEFVIVLPTNEIEIGHVTFS